MLVSPVHSQKYGLQSSKEQFDKSNAILQSFLSIKLSGNFELCSSVIFPDILIVHFLEFKFEIKSTASDASTSYISFKSSLFITAQ